MNKIIKKVRGASMVEYALLLVAILLLACPVAIATFICVGR